MATYQYRLGKIQSLVIANGGTSSDVLDMASENRRPVVITLYGPSALTGTVSVQISMDGTNFQTLQSPSGTDITITAAKCIVIAPLGPCYLKLLSSGAEGAARTFQLTVASFSGS